MSELDVVVIGGGPGGYVAAIRAAQLGMKVALVERAQLGGVCLNWGCIPTKALLRSAEVHHLASHASSFGLETGPVRIDLPAMVERSRKVAGQLSRGVQFLMKKNAVTVIAGEARLEPASSAPRVIVRSADGKDSELSARHVILATGARARTAPDVGLVPDGGAIWTAREAMVPDQVPERLVVVGSGAIGIEFASFFATLGSKVEVVEMLDTILPAEDAEISALARKAFERQGMRFRTGARVTRTTVGASGVTIDLQDRTGAQHTLTADRVIVAIGIVANIEGLGLEALGVTLDRGHVATDPVGRTNVEGLYAIGDVAGAPWLAHKASHEGIACAEAIAGKGDGHHERPLIPGCTYSMPQIASVGMTEAAAVAAGHEVKVGRFPFVANGKAITLGDTEGLVKTVFDAQTGQLLGAHLVGAEVTELIQGFTIAMQLETTEEDLMRTVFPHPTLSEMMHESVLAAYGRALHV
jgi:dihydrolipoamide dehydrogenase